MERKEVEPMSIFHLKCIALVCMVLDHIGFYFEAAPPWLGCIGRISYPLFLFCMAWGYHYTRNRKLHLLRLYLLSIGMTIFSYTLDTLFPTPNGYGNHNIFLSLFLVCLLISTIEGFQRNRKHGFFLLGAIAAAQVFYFLLPNILPFTRQLNGDLLTGIVPNLALNEYGPAFIALGVALYFLLEKTELLSVVYILFSISQFSSEMINGGPVTQWMMLFALPLMLRYNGKKGPGLKYFFYFFYPAHTFFLFYLANFVFV